MCQVPAVRAAASTFSPISIVPASGFSVNTGIFAANSSGIRVPCRVNGWEATMPSSFSFASISAWSS